MFRNLEFSDDNALFHLQCLQEISISWLGQWYDSTCGLDCSVVLAGYAGAAVECCAFEGLGPR